MSWSAIIAGYAENGLGDEALKCFRQMHDEGVCPNTVTYISVLKACGMVGCLEIGEDIGTKVRKQGLLSKDVAIGNALVDMYSKCGVFEKAKEVLEEHPKRNVVTWNALMVGYAQHGDHEGLKDIFRQMFEADMELDNVTYLSIFLAFSHCGLLDEGCRLLMFMMQECNRVLRSEHFSCIIDLLSRGGHLKDAVGFVERMPFQPCSGVWTSVLGACKIYYDIDIAKFVVEMIQELEPQNSFRNRQHYSV